MNTKEARDYTAIKKTLSIAQQMLHSYAVLEELNTSPFQVSNTSETQLINIYLDSSQCDKKPWTLPIQVMWSLHYINYINLQPKKEPCT